MRAHYLQHVAFEGLGSIEPWLIAKGYNITGTRFYQGDALPTPEEIDFLIIMGGPRSVNDEADYPWLNKEKAFIKQVIALKKPVLGICLGAQLIANSLGAKVYPNKQKEIGWFDIHAASATQASSYVKLPQTINVFHWHGETFDLPPNAQLLASSEACANQIFQIEQHVIGLQCHLETTPLSAKAIVQHCGSEIIPAPYIQDASKILAVSNLHYDTINAMMAYILDYLHEALPDNSLAKE